MSFDNILTTELAGDDSDQADNAIVQCVSIYPQRTSLLLFNESTGSVRIYGDAAEIATEQAAEAAALATYTAAAALLDPEDVDYAADLAALAVTRDAAYQTARDAALYMFKLLPQAKYETPGAALAKGAFYCAFETEDGRLLISQFIG